MMFGFLSLPDNWVYITYKDGERKNVSNQDALTQCEADYFKRMWDKKGNPVIKVQLLDMEHNLLKEYTYNEGVNACD